MNVRRIRFWSKVTAMNCILVAVALVTFSILSPIHVAEVNGEASNAGAVNRAPVQRNAAISSASFEAVLDLDLRRPLFDAPPAALIVKASTQPIGPGIQLTGTFVEPGHSFAVFVLPSGRVEVKRVGEKTSDGGAEVMQIDSGSVTLMVNGQTKVLRVAKSLRNTGS